MLHTEPPLKTRPIIGTAIAISRGVPAARNVSYIRGRRRHMHSVGVMMQ